MFKIETPIQDLNLLSQAIHDVMQSLGMHHLDINSIFGEGSVMAVTAGSCLQIDFETACQHQANLFLDLYNNLFDMFDGDKFKMIHWMRIHHDEFGTSPHQVIVSNNGLDSVNNFIRYSLLDKCD